MGRAFEGTGICRPAPTGTDLGENLAYGDQRRLEIARALATDHDCWCWTKLAGGMNEQKPRR